MTSFTEDMRRRGMRAGQPDARARRVVPAGARLGRFLHVSPSEPIVVAKRLRLADGETMAIETLHVRASLVPGLTARDLESESFYDAAARAATGSTIVGGMQTIEPTVTNEEESAALGVPLHSPAFLFERITRSRAGEIVEFVRSIYRGDRYRLVTDLSASAGAAPCRRSRRGTLVKTNVDGHAALRERSSAKLVLTTRRDLCECPRRGQVV